MNLPAIVELAKGFVVFNRYQDGALYYDVFTSPPTLMQKSALTFPVPISDTGDGAFLPSDKAITFMRWIRKHLEFLRESMEKEQTNG